MDSKKEIESVKKIKIVFLGDRGVGKSSVINKFVLNKFQECIPATIGVDFMTKLCKYNNAKYKLELWDTAGQEKYRSLIKGYLRGANACVFVYDNSNPQSYANLIDWIKTFQEVSENEDTCTLIFGNKTDIQIERGQMDKTKRDTMKQYSQLAKMRQILGSAKEGTNISNIFEQILYQCRQNFANSKDIKGSNSNSCCGNE